MAKFPTFPTLYDEVKTISVAKLKAWGYLEPGQHKSGTLTWSSNGRKTGSISITVDTYADNPYLELDYRYRDKPVNYQVALVTVPSNIGKGRVWYFLCPHTGKRCRKLYSVGKLFLHREACTGYLYESQTYSHRTRSLYKLYEKAFGSDKLFEQLYSKHFKRGYAGKPTKRFIKLMQKIKESERTPYSQIERLLFAKYKG